MEKYEDLEERVKKLEELLAQKDEKSDVLDKINNERGITDEEKIKKHRAEILQALDGKQGGKFYSYFDNGNVSAYTILKYDEDRIQSVDSFEAERLFVAFASSERIEILKLLMKKSCTGTEIMQECGFKTTGKLYYHLNFLLNIGMIANDGGEYHLVAQMCGIMQAMFMAAADLERAFKKYEK